jgi:hypothetical protein
MWAAGTVTCQAKHARTAPLGRDGGSRPRRLARRERDPDWVLLRFTNAYPGMNTNFVGTMNIDHLKGNIAGRLPAVAGRIPPPRPRRLVRTGSAGRCPTLATSWMGFRKRAIAHHRPTFAG